MGKEKGEGRDRYAKDVDFCIVQESAGPFVVLFKRATNKERGVAPLIGAPLFEWQGVETAHSSDTRRGRWK